MGVFINGGSPIADCFRHVADTPPLEGLLILRCVIYDPLEGLHILKIKVSEMGSQDLIFGVVNMLHMLSYGHRGGEGGGGGY